MTMKRNDGCSPILTITGSDGTGGSGVQADIKILSALGGYAVTVITSVTVQNTLGIQDFYDLPPDIVLGQIEAIINDVQPRIVKIGMIRRADVMQAVSSVLGRYRPEVVIYDPVAVSSNGDILMSPDLIRVMRRCLLPLVSLLTLKKSDAERILGHRIVGSAGVVEAAGELQQLGCHSVLMHCGNMMAGPNTDVLVVASDSEPSFLSNMCGDTLQGNRHGRSGNLSAAIGGYMSKGQSLEDAVASAYTYMSNVHAKDVALAGRGSELFNEFVNEISAHFTSHNDVRFYADLLNVSSTYLAQVTKRIAGKAPKTIIDEYLVSEIESMLLSSTKTVQEIAYSVGFGSQAHFAKFFKKMTGLTPSEYRRQKR